MKKAIVAIGVFILIIGILLVILPFAHVPKTTSEAYQVPKSEVLLQGWTGMAAFSSFKNAAKGTELYANELLNIQVNATESKGIDFSVNAVNDTTGDVLATSLLSRCFNTKRRLECSFDFRLRFCFHQQQPIHI